MGDEAELIEKTGPVTCDEALQIARRYNASHARYSMPVNFARDDDVRLESFIVQMRLRLEALGEFCVQLALLKGAAEADYQRSATDYSTGEMSAYSIMQGLAKRLLGPPVPRAHVAWTPEMVARACGRVNELCRAPSVRILDAWARALNEIALAGPPPPRLEQASSDAPPTPEAPALPTREEIAREWGDNPYAGPIADYVHGLISQHLAEKDAEIARQRAKLAESERDLELLAKLRSPGSRSRRSWN